MQNLKKCEPAPLRRPEDKRFRSERQFEKLGLSDLRGSELLVLTTVIGNSIIERLERRERVRFYRAFLLIASGLVVLYGLAILAIQLIRS